MVNRAATAPFVRERVRSTERGEAAAGAVARKRFGAPGLLARLGVRPRPALRELRLLARLRAAGLPVPEPLALERDDSGRDVLVMRWIEGARDLATVWDELREEATARRRLARTLGVLVRRLHEQGVAHRDLHAGNVLVREHGGRHEAFLLDFHGAREHASERARRADLISLAHHFLSRTRASERLRFARAAGFGAGLGTDRRAELGAAALRSRRAFQLHHERRCDGSGRAFARVRGGVARAEHAPQLLELGADAASLAVLARTSGRLVHRSANGDAELFRLEHPAFGFPLAVKCFDDRGPVRRVLRGSRARRAWRNLFRLEMAGLPVARPIGFLESANGPRPRSVLVTEFLDGHVPLDVWLARRGGPPPQPLLESTARMLARMHDDGLSHRDLKAANLLVAPEGTRATFVDADGIARPAALPLARAARDLMRLNASFEAGGAVSWRARGRFLVHYRRARCVLRPGLRETWRTIASLTETKWRRRSAHGTTAGR